ncbi:uncharacterized protein A4U43_C03F26090 [Asparagus officinalis]|uniref:DUF632 domain-containing protein n=2 Tax=Asparagus officinalis TaxID=4686 RepID=A0A5P1FEY4_ASPOF|nr:uncharacterized protein A4U43_C03F26090 [Asparagus officinalis]
MRMRIRTCMSLLDSDPNLDPGEKQRRRGFQLILLRRFGSELGSRRETAQEGVSAYPPPQFPSSFLNPTFYQDPVTGRFDYRQPYLDGGQYPTIPTFVNPNYYPNPVTGGQFPKPSFYYMKKSATTPSTFYVDPNNMEGSEYSNYSSYYYNVRGPTFGDERGNVADSSPGRQAPEAAVPPPPPAPEGSGWDFFNVFDSYEQYLMKVKGTLRSGPGSVSSPDSSEIREKEGIPDLEEETEPESFREVEKKKEVVGLSIGTSKAPPLEELVKEKTENIMNERVREEKAPSVKEEIFVRKKGVSFEVEGSIKTEESSPGSSLRSSLVTEESRSTDGIELHVHGTKDVVEAVEEIKEQFKSASGCGEEVARLLEVGKLRYRSRRTLLRVIFSRILDSLSLSTLTSLSQSSTGVRHPNLNVPKEHDVMGSDYINRKSDNLAATLEKLYTWEKKLYKEVKDEEKLRVLYEKECRRLKAMDDGGAESSKIDSTRSVIRTLLTNLSIAIKSVDGISFQIHKLRDEELRPQVIKLIQGLMTMWKSVLACHQRQFQAIAESKSHNLTARSRYQRNSIAKATMELEVELLNWSSCFQKWISTQKAYIEALNGWLMKWLLQEQEETPDGVLPFSPGRIGAPTIFIVSNDWHHTVDNISEVGVTTAMQIFADNVHKLWETQDEEQRQKLKAEYLSRDFSRRLRSHQKENGHVDIASSNRPMPLSNNASSHDDHIKMALDSMKKRLEEEKVKHLEIMKHVQEVASSSLQTGLIPIFEALGNYSTETLRGYEALRIPSDNFEGT